MRQNEEDVRPSFWLSMKGFWAICAIIILVWLSSFRLFPWLFGWEHVGVAGDMFGGLTALFSGLAFAGLIFTLLVQKNELDLQRGELRLARREYELQRFEGTLFGLIKQLRDHVLTIRSSKTVAVGSSILSVEPGSGGSEGQRALRSIAHALPDQISLEPGEMDLYGNVKNYREVRSTFDEQIQQYGFLFASTLEEDLGPYMRILYGIFRHIEFSGLDEHQKKMYSRIARAGLSSAELKIVFFDCSSGVGRDFVDWIEKFGLLKHLPQSVRLANPDMVSKYSPAAFEVVPIPHTRI